MEPVNCSTTNNCWKLTSSDSAQINTDEYNKLSYTKGININKYVKVSLHDKNISQKYIHFHSIQLYTTPESWANRGETQHHFEVLSHTINKKPPAIVSSILLPGGLNLHLFGLKPRRKGMQNIQLHKHWEIIINWLLSTDQMEISCKTNELYKNVMRSAGSS